ncbi:N-succinylglutamate 5-semialdehyde dehydrogenase [Alcanivorax sp. ALC70]|nr:N-succinylglutamate 5-semialdehyde dehydrogenase [Alcanivorax sp. ALC70]
MRNNFIGGAWTRGADTRDNINPSDTTDVIGEYAQADAAQTADAIAAARRAFPAWRAAGIQARADALDVIGLELAARKEELGRLLSGKRARPCPRASPR